LSGLWSLLASPSLNAFCNVRQLKTEIVDYLCTIHVTEAFAITSSTQMESQSPQHKIPDRYSTRSFLFFFKEFPCKSRWRVDESFTQQLWWQETSGINVYHSNKLVIRISIRQTWQIQYIKDCQTIIAPLTIFKPFLYL
jgi:hypothetical protein